MAGIEPGGKVRTVNQEIGLSLWKVGAAVGGFVVGITLATGVGSRLVDYADKMIDGVTNPYGELGDRLGDQPGDPTVYEFIQNYGRDHQLENGLPGLAPVTE